MPAERVAMRQAREIIRLKFSAGVSTREIARRLGLAPSTVRETLIRLEGAGLVWPLPEGMGDAGLEAALYAKRRSKRGVCTDNLNPGVAVMKSAQDGA
jgi:DNA-binding transcriptional ArsR family regulator